jgi:predicted DNA-binding transcriptional regulator AlpA
MERNHSLLTEQNTALQLGVSVPALRKWRYQGRGPKFFKLGSLVRYRPEDIDQWLLSRPQGGEPSPQRAAVGGVQ